MASSVTGINLKETFLYRPYGKGQPIAIALLILLGIGGLVTAGCGVVGYCGAFSQLSQVESIAMMACGGGAALLAFALAITLGVRRQSQMKTRVKPGEELIYGPEAYDKLKVKTVGNLQPQPQVDWSQPDPFVPGKTLGDNCFLLNVPEKFIIDGIEKHTTTDLVAEMIKSSGLIELVDYTPFYENPLEPGWYLLWKNLRPFPKPFKDMHQQIKVLNAAGCLFPRMGVFALATLMHLAQTGELLFTSKQVDKQCMICDDMGNQSRAENNYFNYRTLIVERGYTTTSHTVPPKMALSYLEADAVTIGIPVRFNIVNHDKGVYDSFGDGAMRKL